MDPRDLEPPELENNNSSSVIDINNDASNNKKEEEEEEEERRQPIVHSTELKPLIIANWITHPCGCIAIVIFTFLYMGGLLYSLTNPYELCLQFNFSDFKVIGSTIADNWYQKSLSSDYDFDAVFYCNCSNDLRRRRRRRRRSLAELEIYVFNDYYWRASSAIYLEVFFYSLKSNNILTAEQMQEAHEIELGIKDWDGYHDRSLLYKGSYAGETAYLEALTGSFLNVLFPSTITVIGGITLSDPLTYYDGNGNNNDLSDDDVKEYARDIVTNFPQYSFFDYDFYSQRCTIRMDGKYLPFW